LGNGFKILKEEDTKGVLSSTMPESCKGTDVASINPRFLFKLHLKVKMHPFATYVLRSYFKETGWNEDNLYSNLTRSSTGNKIP
jgi:hypothetical protein